MALDKKMKLIVAITAASGAIYARQLLEIAIADEIVTQIALILSSNAEEVVNFEGVTLPKHPKITIYTNDDLFAPPASGSADWDAMVCVPCSAGTLARVANGISDTLLTRSADVMLKERRPLLLVLRESPLSLIHLRNMTLACEAGATIFPASPSFYSPSEDIETLTRNFSSRVADFLGIKNSLSRWEGKEQ